MPEEGGFSPLLACRSSHRRARASANPLTRGGPTDPLPPPAFLAFGQTASSAATLTSDTDEEGAPLTGSLRLLTATPTEDFPLASRQAGVWGPGGGGVQPISSDSDESQGGGSSYRSVGGVRPPSPVHVPSPDEEERRMLDRLMTGSPGSGESCRPLLCLRHSPKASACPHSPLTPCHPHPLLPSRCAADQHDHEARPSLWRGEGDLPHWRQHAHPPHGTAGRRGVGAGFTVSFMPQVMKATPSL